MFYDDWKATESKDLRACICGDDTCQGECYETDYKREDKENDTNND